MTRKSTRRTTVGAELLDGRCLMSTLPPIGVSTVVEVGRPLTAGPTIQHALPGPDVSGSSAWIPATSVGGGFLAQARPTESI
jgi:hypothetical protein